MLVEADHLVAFARIAAEGSVTRAAGALHKSQPALSQQMARLREAVGDPLYRRTRHGVSLTPAGEALLPHAEALTRALHGARALADSWRTLHSGGLVLAASTTVAHWWLPARLASFAASHPRLQLGVLTRNSQDAVALLARGEAELAIVEGPMDEEPPPDWTEATVLATDQIVLACRPDSDLAQRGVITPAQLTGMALVRREPGSGTRESVDRALGQVGVTPVTRLEVTGVAAVVAAIRAGLAPGFVSRLAIAEDLEAGRLREVPVRGLHLEREFTCLSPRPELCSPAAKAFLQALRG
ncbi:MAG: LysR family transcriptional regulator [Trueperaceae bacterium]